MDSERERLLRAGLWMVRGVSSRAIDSLAASPRGLAAALGDRAELARLLGLGEAAGTELARAPADLAGWARALEQALAKRGGRFVWRGDADYPDLGALPDPPEVFTVRGTLRGSGARPLVAVIGSRRVDVGALRLARAFGAALGRAGCTVVSGGALGIDAAAHEGALDAGGHTVAVLGSGLLRPQPMRNRDLFARILAAGGALCGELPPDAGAMKWHFPRRNRLVAALASAVVVVRAGAGSGCTYTVEAAQRLERRVFVVPSAGLGTRGAYGEWLLGQDGVAPVPDPPALLEALGLGASRRTAPPGLEPDERQVLDALLASEAGGVPLAALAAAAGLEPGAASRILARLCGRGLARAAGPGRFAA